MRDKIAKIFKASGFETDRNVHIMTSALETDLDVCALYQEVIIIVQCKTGTNISFGNLISEWNSKRTGIINEKNTLNVLGSIDRLVTQQRLKAIENFKVVIAFRDYSPTHDQIRQARNYGIEILDSDAIEYYERTSGALGSWTKFEIFKEMNIKRREEAEVIPRPALRLRQPGAELYIFTLAPYRLLRIAYVYRRSLKERYAYQRMVNQSRIERIGHFLNREQAFLPNAILLAFDAEISKKVSFTPRAAGDDIGEISIPMNYCSSWIVDGQHRLYGFIKTPYSEPPPERPEPVTKFDVLIVGLKDFEREDQAKTFVDVNDNQKRIDPTLLCDLTTFIGDLRHPLTWPSLLVKKLNLREPWKNRIRVLEIERDKPITLVGFAKWALSKELLRRKERKDGTIEYVGPLFKYAQFDYTRKLDYKPNEKALDNQTDLLVRYFTAIKQALDQVSEDIWNNPLEYGVTKTTAVNAFLLVLNRLMEIKPQVDIDLESYLKPIKKISFRNRIIVRYGGGWEGFKGLANRIIRELNSKRPIKLESYKRKKKS